MPPTRNFVYESLLKFNYLSEQKEKKDELPPLINSRTFTTSVANQLCSSALRSGLQRGYDLIEYRITRYNNVSRHISIPHPKPYAHLAKSISDNWYRLNHICNNSRSLVYPRTHIDGRIIVMNYEDNSDQLNTSYSFVYCTPFVKLGW